MPMVMILSPADADRVRGPSTETPGLATLQPIALLDGTFYLGVETLTDPNFTERQALLAGLPVVDFSTIQTLISAPPG